MKEKPVEERFKERLEAHGFLVIKLTTPGYTGVMDRLILRPKWSPGAPYFCEIKRPGGELRRKQELVRDDWRLRGAIVLKPVTCYDECDSTLKRLLEIVASERIDGK